MRTSKYQILNNLDCRRHHLYSENQAGVNPGMMLRSLVVAATFISMTCSSGAESKPSFSSLSLRFSSLNHENEDSTTPTVIAEVLEKFNGGRAGPCHTLVYFDRYTMSNELLMKLQESMGGAPVMLLDVTKLKFGLITAKRRASSLPKVDLLIKRPEKDTCRVLLSWSRAHFQRSLLVLARFYPEIIRLKDVLILSTEDKNIGKFIPQLKRRIVVRKSVSVARCNSTQVRFVVEQSCTACDDVYMQNIAEWDRDAGMAWKKSGENTMSGVLIKVSYTTSVPNIFNTSKGVLDGLELRMLQYASEALNFTYVLQVPRDGECGRIVNGSWTGKVGDVVYRRADLAIGGIVYRSQTSIFASYSTMFHNELWSIVCPPPSKMPLWLYVMFPFKSGMAPSVFTVLVVFHGFTFAIVMLTFNFEWRAIETETSFTRSVKNVFRVASSFYLKIMVCLYFWNMLFCILEPQYEETISSSLGLLSSTKKYGVVRDTTVESILANSLDASQGELAKNARQFSSSEGQYSVDVHGMCLVGVPELYAKFIIRSQYITRCGEPAVQVSGENLHTVMGGWLMASKSPLKEKFDPIITRLQGFGFLDKWRADLYASLTRHRNERRPCRVQSVGPLSLLDLRLAFFFLITGWMIALVVLLVERVAFNFVRSFNAEFGPTYNEAFSSVSGRSCQPQRKWAHKVLDGVNPNRETSWDYQRNKAKFGYQMYVLLRDITEGDVMRRGSQLLPRRDENLATENNLGGKEALKVMQVTATDEQHNAELGHPTSHRSFNSLHAIVPQITQVEPYVTPLSRAVRIFPRNENVGKTHEHQMLPNIPYAPWSSSTHRPHSLENFCRGNNRIEKETLRHIGEFGSNR